MIKHLTFFIDKYSHPEDEDKRERLSGITLNVQKTFEEKNPYWNEDELAKQQRDKLSTIALFSDIFSDNKATEEELLKEGMNQETIDYIKLLTPHPCQSKENFIIQCEKTQITRMVQKATIQYDSDMKRIDLYSRDFGTMLSNLESIGLNTLSYHFLDGKINLHQYRSCYDSIQRTISGLFEE